MTVKSLSKLLASGFGQQKKAYHTSDDYAITVYLAVNTISCPWMNLSREICSKGCSKSTDSHHCFFFFEKKKAITAALTYRFPSKSPNKKVCHLWRYNFELFFKSAVSSFNSVAWGRAQFSTGNQLGLLYHSGVVASYKEGLRGGSRGPSRSP